MNHLLFEPRSALDVRHGAEWRLGHGSTCFATHARTADRDQSIAQVPDFVDIDMALRKGLRSWWRVASAVIVSPQCSCFAASALPRVREGLDRALEVLLTATRPAAAKARISASEPTVEGAAWRRSLAGIPSSLVCAHEAARV